MSQYQKGYNARKRGRPRSANPNALDTDPGIAWDTGWSSADVDEQVKREERKCPTLTWTGVGGSTFTKSTTPADASTEAASARFQV